MTKPVFRTSDKDRLKTGCTTAEDGQRLEISDLGCKRVVQKVKSVQRSGTEAIRT